MKTFLGIAFAALVLLGSQSYIRGQFDDRSSLDLSDFRLPIKYQTRFSTGKKFIALWTLRALAPEIVGHQPCRAGEEGKWNNQKILVRSSRGESYLE